MLKDFHVLVVGLVKKHGQQKTGFLALAKCVSKDSSVRTDLWLSVHSPAEGQHT